MLNFEINNPTHIIFGKDQLDKLPAYISKFYPGKKILLAYGGGSIEKTGLLERVKAQLNDFELVLFPGIEANPQFTTLMKAAELIRRENIGFILAVGGGSVIDGVKFISGAVNYQGDPWDVLLRKPGCVFGDALPFGTILTIPATGSEANSGAVISRSEIHEKRTMGGPQFFPKFSFLDPTVVATLPKRQVANGIVDAYMHTLEQYLTFPTDNLLQERQAEAILSTLIEIAPAVYENPANYTAAANLMWCAIHALNGNLRCGVPTDWATHMIGHELTAFFGIDHARTLAIIAPRLYEALFDKKKEKLVQYGKRVWQLSGDETAIAQEAIAKTEAFFQSLGMETRISAYTDEFAGIERKIRQRFEERSWKLGEHKDLGYDEVERIVKAAI
ncbi:MAG: NADH-dependent alcohol dehydrogenase [Crocinitomicaceae bacterium]|jgi:NADP-dependent alcohol dehydrogenase|nr:NADH-dependent alcohol dehydrogenase [Crocinitomicaceae bacterium]